MSGRCLIVFCFLAIALVNVSISNVDSDDQVSEEDQRLEDGGLPPRPPLRRQNAIKRKEKERHYEAYVQFESCRWSKGKYACDTQCFPKETMMGTAAQSDDAELVASKVRPHPGVFGPPCRTGAKALCCKMFKLASKKKPK